ncbi:MAG TPA: hypothetical protein VN458_06535 [Solirubrobacterales bacterium]|nr:hypothetical protein [Solirubrobacterales bacterium]
MEDFMERREFEEHPEDLERAADWLRAQRPEVSALELDRIKQRALAQATRDERRGAGKVPARRPLATALTALALTASLGGALAIAGKGPPSSPPSSGSSSGSAAVAQYCPPGKAGKQCRKDRKKQCLAQAEADKKAFEQQQAQQKATFDQQQKQQKATFDQQQKQAKAAFEATHPTAQQRKAFDKQQAQDKEAFEQQQKQDKAAFDQQQAQARKNFMVQYEAQKKACEEEAQGD